MSTDALREAVLYGVERCRESMSDYDYRRITTVLLSESVGQWPGRLDKLLAPASETEKLPAKWTEREQQVINDLMRKTGLSEHRVLLQGLRLYQLIQSGTHKVVELEAALKADRQGS
jgi:hypothetical protein